MGDAEFEDYMKSRVEDQIKYFDSSALKNQLAYRRLKLTGIACNVLTTMTIALAFTVQDPLRLWAGILALALSTAVLGTYQLEEFQNYGAKWEKFRLVAEQLKSEKYMFVNRAGAYSELDEDAGRRELIERIEGTIRGTDIAYFSLMVEPGRRIEKRLQQPEERR
ncbi:MAG TPA: DUF4231 domain-containing protein [Candidatus Limnocylindrales bacterium]|nr:DUF4231 domain-containing protein [Candidatus Limnocylindrales bacterium]